MARIAIIGSGISGLYSAHTLGRNGHDVVLYEAAEYLGGHTNTHHVEMDDGQWSVDSGFIVFNQATYPLFIRFLDELGVASQPAPMSFSVHCAASGFEYGSADLRSLLARPRNLVDPRFYRMVRDIFRFNRESRQFTSGELAGTLGDCLRRRAYSADFQRFYILPMAAAIWSAPVAQITEFPLGHFVRFFRNHGLLSVSGDVQWRTVTGGSDSYVRAFARCFSGRVRLATPVRGLVRDPAGVRVLDARGETDQFDEVILACHSDQALEILGSGATPGERRVLGAIPYQHNRAILHTDVSVLPHSRAAWSAWNYRLTENSQERATLSYCMNRLQSLAAAETFVVTLNDTGLIDPDRILREIDYAHPVYDPPSDAARSEWAAISGQERTHFCGAYWFSGFHEDGVRSAKRVCEQIGAAREQVAA